MAIPFLGCSLKLEAILSTIMVLDKSLLIKLRSLILTKSYSLVCYLYNRYDILFLPSIESKIESAYCLTAAVNITI